MFFSYWLDRAKKGDSFSAGLVWSVMRTAVKERRLSEEQWELLSGLLDATLVDGRGSALQAAANRALGLGRRAGRKAQHEVEEHWRRLAEDVFSHAGHVKGDALDAACDAVLSEVYGPSDPDSPRDLRKLKRAYVANLEHFMFLQRLSKEVDDDRG